MSETIRPWLESYDPQVRPELDYESMPAFGILDKAARKHPNRPALICHNNTITYAQLQNKAEIMAANLRKHGVMPGDRVAIMLPNLPQTIISYWAVLKAGACVVMTNPLYMETEIVHQINDSGAKHLITLDLLWPRIDPLQDRLCLERVYLTSIPEAMRFPINLVAKLKLRREGKVAKVRYDNRRLFKWKSLLKGKETYSREGIMPQTDLALLQYTGGTTGVSKGCMITHANIIANVTQCMEMLHSVGKIQEVFLSVLPFFHVYGLTVGLNFPTMLGATILPFPRFEPRDVLKAIGKMKPTIFPGAPSVYIALMQQKECKNVDFSSLRFCVSGSAPMPMEMMKRFKKLTGAEIIEGYGLTEASPVTHLNPLQGSHKPGSIGLPFPDTEARIVDMEVGGPPLPPGKIGELIIKGPQVMKGYWNRPDETASTLRNGWLYTGDIATMDDEGYFTIVDRKKDLIISAGYNIYPRDIDEVLYTHPKVKEAVVVGIPHKTRGEIVKAFIVAEDGEELTREEIMAFCKEKLALYKVPRKIEFRKELPKTLVGKVLRRALRDEELAKRKKKDGKKPIL